MANRSFLAALWDGDIVGAAGTLVAGIMHMVVMGLLLLLLGLTAPVLALVMPFVAYQVSADNIGVFAFCYFFFGAFAAAVFTGMLYVIITRKERKARGETFAEHCRNVGLWPIASIFGSFAADIVFFVMFKDLLWSDSNMAHAIFFALAPIAVFAPLWAFLIHRRRQKMARKNQYVGIPTTAEMVEYRRLEETMWEKMRDAEFLRSQGIVS
jgi:uncharacterized membrane protein YvlD (DUF360 family)